MAITATMASKCGACRGGIAPGDPILKQRGRWVHESCYVSKDERTGQQLLPGMGLLARLRQEQEKQKKD